MADAAPTTAAPSNAEILAELQALGSGAPAPASAAAATEPEAAPEAPAEEPEAPVEDEADPDDEADPKIARGREQLTKLEKHLRGEVARERAEVERQRAELAEDVKALREFQALSKRARYDVVGVLKALGVTEDMFEDAGVALYAHTEKGKADPRYRAKAEQTARERQLADQLAEMQKRLDERDAKEKEAALRTEQEKAATRYVDSIAKAVTPKLAPLAADCMAEDAEGTRKQLAEIAGMLWEQTGEQPEPRDVLKAFERLEAQRLERAEKILARRKKPAAPAAPAAAKAAAPTPSGTVTDAELLAELQSGNIR